MSEEEFGWLDDVPVLNVLPPEQNVSAQQKVARIVKKDSLVPKHTTRVSFLRDWRYCTARQREYLRALEQYNWSNAKAAAALRKTGCRVAKNAHAQWYVAGKCYANVYDHLKARARLSVVDKDKLILNAEEIRINALKPKPILFKGVATGHYENKPDTALRAVELLMKTQKMLGNEQETQGQGNGPPLIIQIVQGDNKVIDVTRGVTIDLPSPADAS